MSKKNLINRGSALQSMQEDSSYSKFAGEELTWPYYDQAIMANATREHQLFSQGLAGKNLSQTNMPTSGSLPQGQAFEIHDILLMYQAVEARSELEQQMIFEMLGNTTLEFKVPGKASLLTITLLQLMGFKYAVTTVPSVPGDNVPQPEPFFTAKFSLGSKPIKIGATQSFTALITHHVAPNAGLDGDKFWICMNGELKRLS